MSDRIASLIASLYENDHDPVPTLWAVEVEIFGNFLFTHGYKNMWGGSPLPHTDDITPKEVLQNLISRDTTCENVLRGPNLGLTAEKKIINLGGMALWQKPGAR